MRPRRRAPIRAQYAMCSVTTRIALLGGCAGSLKPAWGSADRCVGPATRPRGRRDVPTVFVRRCDHSALRLSYIIRPGCRKSARARSGALAMAAERRANGLSIRFPAMALALAGRGPGRILSLLWRAWGLDWLLQAFPGISAARIMGVAAGGQLLIPARDHVSLPSRGDQTREPHQYPAFNLARLIIEFVHDRVTQHAPAPADLRRLREAKDATLLERLYKARQRFRGLLRRG